MRILEAEEQGLIPLRVDASTRIRRDVLEKEYVSLRTDKNWEKGDQSYAAVDQKLIAGNIAGLLPVSEEVAVFVKPRFPLSLTHMVNAVGEHTLALDFLRDYQQEAPEEEAADWMLDHLATSFVDAVEAVVHQGLQRTYLERRVTTSSPKGRVLAGTTLSRLAARGIDYKAEVAFHERTEQTPLNQAVLEGLHWVLAWSEGRKHMRGAWQRTIALLHIFGRVTRDRAGLFKHDALVLHPRLLSDNRSAYRRALPLAIALLERRGFTLDVQGQALGLSSLLVDTALVFEAFVRLRLQEYSPDPSLTVVDGNTMEDRPLYTPIPDDELPAGARRLGKTTAKIAPDVLIERGEETLLVGDVKYVPIKEHAARDHIEQLITYAHRLNCTRVVSIHPALKETKPGLFATGRIGKTDIFSYRVDLDAQDVEDEMRKMARTLHALCVAP